ncbi:MAG: bifunctional isocitrate dehydrogenase kinase/phosphatase, partial [Acidobacteria bacterium]|nr:bifunctional isocitrate dehydrogenase kinase/phosphatase [Acidobacteriota bacterium]MDW7985081.1 bifunctional isocitrate dehydrogenase kinase/phosphatase [Acidobacteriota bacterium]
MPVVSGDEGRAREGATAILEAFDAYHRQFRDVTRRARDRFERRDWAGILRDAAARLDLYREAVDQAVATLHRSWEDRVDDPILWMAARRAYAGLLTDRDDWELAETFFNSVTRRIFSTVGVDPRIEFVHTAFETPSNPAGRACTRVYEPVESIEALLGDLLRGLPFRAPFADLDRDVSRAARAIESHRCFQGLPPIHRAEMIPSVFFRNKGAYLVGKLFAGPHAIPFALALLHPPEGITLDAVLLDEDEISILFSFAHWYFLVLVDRPYDVIQFLRTLLPRKRPSELYTAIGYHKHGKTEFYRELLDHLAHSDDRFVLAPGEPGTVMTVFTLPHFEAVFKVIKDRFDYPKRTSRKAVMEKYYLVFKHDRAGRLVDTQEFEHLKFDRSRFDPTLLTELLCMAGHTVQADATSVVVRHVYIQRRVMPLNLYIRAADEKALWTVIDEYGQAIKDLAHTNIFPGDLLIKNFGVTRHGRVVLYDYDELNWVTNLQFRQKPPPRDDWEDLSDEPWYPVGPNDVFPEELVAFVEFPQPWRSRFLERHGDLGTVQ